MSTYHKMPDSGSRIASLKGRMSIPLILSYAFDWFVVIAMGFVALGLGYLEPNKRPFALDDPSISFEYTENETVPSWLLILLQAITPAVGILIVSIIFVPGATVPSTASRGLVWRRKLWELQIGLLGLALSIVIAWFFTNGMKQLFGRARPDMLSRCEPDLENAENYLVSSLGNFPGAARLYSADICQSTDEEKLWDGFRSYPSGHSSSAAAGLVYFSLYLASKFAVVIPFVASASYTTAASSHAAFPSRMPASDETTRLNDGRFDEPSSATSGPYKDSRGPAARQNSHIQSIRLQSAAAPVYLLVITLIPFGVSIFIAASRWYDYRHHGFDILFGYLMGLIPAIYSFRYYHLPIQAGAGWAWGPRSSDRAFWAGVGRLGYVTDHDAAVAPLDAEVSSSDAYEPRPLDPNRLGGSTAYPPPPEHMVQRGPRANGQAGPFHDVEMHPMNGNRV